MKEKLEEYLRSEARGEVSPAFANPTRWGLLLGVGESKFMLSRYAGEALDVEADKPSGPYTFEELIDLDLQEPKPVITDIAFEGETIVIAGRPKVGKTRLVHQAAFAIAQGTPFLDMIVPRSRRVLIIDLENRLPALKSRLMRMAGNVAEPSGIFLWCGNSLNENIVNATDKGVDTLRRWIEDERGSRHHRSLAIMAGRRREFR